MQTPKVTVIIPTYNRENFVGEAVMSIIDQTYSNWECIIVDDNSTDRSLEKISSLIQGDDRFIIVVKDKSLGRGAQRSRNLGLQRATGRYVLFLDSDDLLSPACIAGRVSFMEQHPGVTFSIFPGLRFKKEPYDSLTIISTYRGNDPIKAFLEFNTPWTIINCIWRREELLRRNLCFNEQVMGFQDIDFHLHALFKGMTHEMARSEPDCFWREQQYDNIGKHLADESFVHSHVFLVNKIKKSIVTLEKGTERYEKSLRRFILFILRMQLAKRKFASFELFLQNMIDKGLLNGIPVIVLRLLAHLYKISEESSPLITRWIFFFYKITLLGALPFCKLNKHFLIHKYKKMPQTGKP